MSPDAQSRKASVVSLISSLLLVYAAICGLLFVKQRSMIYFPSQAVNVPRAEDLRITSGDATLQVWQVGGQNPHAILYFGGNAEDVSSQIGEFTEYFAGYTVYLANYRSYGASTGSPSEAAILRDAEVLYDEFRNRHRSVTVIGRSLGSGVAVHLATSREVVRLILITPYDSLVNVAAARYRIFPVSLLLRDRFDSIKLTSLIDIPTLVIAAEYDEIIPIRHAQALAETIRRDLLEYVVVSGAGHNSLGDFAEYRLSLIEFMAANDRQT